MAPAPPPDGDALEGLHLDGLDGPDGEDIWLLEVRWCYTVTAAG